MYYRIDQNNTMNISVPQRRNTTDLSGIYPIDEGYSPERSVILVLEFFLCYSDIYVPYLLGLDVAVLLQKSCPSRYSAQAII